MNKKVACFLALCVVSMGFVALLPTVSAYQGSVLTGDGGSPPNYKDHFDLGEMVYYYVHAAEDGGQPLQLKNINITISGPTGQVHTNVITTDQYGDASGSWWGTGTPDLYTIYANYSGQNVAMNTFRVYDPIPFDVYVETYMDGPRDSGGTPAYYFASDDWIYFSIYVTDQYGNPYYEWPPWVADDIQYWIYHNENEVDFDSDQTDDEGYIDDSFRPYWYFSGDEVYGIYEINVTREDGTPLNETFDFTFEVIDVDIEVTPSKSLYAQGEEITIIVQTSVTGNIDVQILDPDDDVLSGASWTDQMLINGQWSRTYVLGSNLPDGYYEIQVLKDGNLMKSRSITVKKFSLEIWTDSGGYLPGDEITVYYTITNNKDGSGVTDATIEWIFEYYDTDDFMFKTRDMRFSSNPYGSFQVSIPRAASTFFDGDLDVWANDTSDHSDHEHKSINIGGISAYLSIDGDEFIAGDFIVTTITAYVDSSYPLRNGNVYLNVSKDGQEITTYTQTSLKTDKEGRLTYIFMLQATAEEGHYTMAINVSKEDEWDIDSENFEVVEKRDLSVIIGFPGKHYSEDETPKYYSGETVKVTYSAFRGEEIVQNINCEYRAYYGSNNILAGITSSGEFTFTAPSDFDGYLNINIEVTDSDGMKAYQYAEIYVSRTGLLLETNANEYLPGDTIKVEYSTVGTQITDAEYYYEIEDDNDNIVKRGSLTTTSGEFQFTVPEDVNVPDSYTIRGYITDGNGVNIAQRSVTVTRLMGYMLSFTLDKNTYRPGETATLKYKIVSVDGSEIPDDFTLFYGYGSPTLYTLGGPYRTLQTSKDEGSLKIKVPEDAAEGTGYFYVISSDLPYGEHGFASDTQEAKIRESPNPFAETVGDMSLLELILLILVIVTLIIAIIGWRGGKKALAEAKLPPWKKEGPLPEPEKFKEPGAPEVPMGEEPLPPPPDDEMPPSGQTSQPPGRT